MLKSFGISYMYKSKKHIKLVKKKNEFSLTAWEGFKRR